MKEQNQTLETLQDIRRMMDRSSRFISLSGFSGIAAGLLALAGSWIANDLIYEYGVRINQQGFDVSEFQKLKLNLITLALGILAAALVAAFYFTWRRVRKNKLPLWDLTSRRVIINLIIPLVAGGVFILAMLQQDEWHFVAPASLVFYGLALVNAGKYTLSEVRYLGLFQILLGLINTQMIGSGLYFWAAGFGGLHIIYGILMWWKYERVQPNH